MVTNLFRDASVPAIYCRNSGFFFFKFSPIFSAALCFIWPRKKKFKKKNFRRSVFNLAEENIFYWKQISGVPFFIWPEKNKISGSEGKSHWHPCLWSVYQSITQLLTWWNYVFFYHLVTSIPFLKHLLLFFSEFSYTANRPSASVSKMKPFSPK